MRDDGETFEWGRVLVCDPPHRLVLSWYPSRTPETAQEVEFRFTDLDGATRVDLEHRGWDTLGDEAADLRRNYQGGWETVLGEFRSVANESEQER